MAFLPNDAIIYLKGIAEVSRTVVVSFTGRYSSPNLNSNESHVSPAVGEYNLKRLPLQGSVSHNTVT